MLRIFRGGKPDFAGFRFRKLSPPPDRETGENGFERESECWKKRRNGKNIAKVYE